MRAGSAVIYLGSTIHAGGANVTADERRRGMHVSYCVGWLRTEENQYLSAPPDVVRTMPRQSQELLGYAAHDALAVRRRATSASSTCATRSTSWPTASSDPHRGARLRRPVPAAG